MSKAKKALGKRVIVEIIEEDLGLEISDDAKESRGTVEGKILSIGAEAGDELEIGDVVTFNRRSIFPLSKKTVKPELVAINLDDLLAVEV